MSLGLFKAGTFMAGLAAEAVKRIRNRPKAVARRAAKAARKSGQAVPVETRGFNMLPKGSQTLSGIAVLVLVPWAAKFGMSSEEVTVWVTAVGTVIGGVLAVAGYLRRKKMPAE